MFKQPETFRATAPGKFLMLAGGTAAREAVCHCVRVTSTGREQVWDSVPGPLERDVRLWQTVPSKVWQHVPEGFYLIFLLKRCQQALNHGKKQASQNTHPYQNSSPILEQIQLEEFEKRWVNFWSDKHWSTESRRKPAGPQRAIWSRKALGFPGHSTMSGFHAYCWKTTREEYIFCFQRTESGIWHSWVAGSPRPCTPSNGNWEINLFL